jgi:hypothetical protein
MAGVPFRLLDGMDRHMFEGGVGDAQVVEAAEQSGPVGRHDRSYSQKTAFASIAPALLPMSTDVICARDRASVIDRRRPWAWAREDGDE